MSKVHYADYRLDSGGAVLRSVCGQCRFYVGDENASPALRARVLQVWRSRFHSSGVRCARCERLLRARGVVLS